MQDLGAWMTFSCSSSWSFSVVGNILLEGFPLETPFAVLFHLVVLLKARLRWSARQGELSIAIKPHPCLVKKTRLSFKLYIIVLLNVLLPRVQRIKISPSLCKMPSSFPVTGSEHASFGRQLLAPPLSRRSNSSQRY